MGFFITFYKIKMNTLYILPGWEDSGREEGYLKIESLARTKGYNVVMKSIDWTRPLSRQLFEVEKESVVFGFSLGAILAWLTAQREPVNHLILASMTPHYSFTDPEIKNALIDLAGEEFVDDILHNLKKSHKAKRQTVLYGDQEGEHADILVKETDHELTDNYVVEVLKLL
jgi:dienelactone hydrolase